MTDDDGIRGVPRNGLQPEVRPESDDAQSLADILATATALGRPREVLPPEWDDAPSDVKLLNPQSRRDDDVGADLLTWLLHETDTIRDPVYRVSAQDRDQPTSLVADPDPEQLPLIAYQYDQGTLVLSRLGELTARDVRVMSVVSQLFWEAGCPAHNAITGDKATLGFIARQLGMPADGSAMKIRASIQRLATTKVVWKRQQTVVDHEGQVQETDQVEVSIGFLANWGTRSRKVRGQAERKTNFLLLDQLMAERIRSRHYTWLRADIVRRLKDDALATKMYMFMRTHRPNERGEIEYGVMRLAKALGCSDTKKARVKRKIEAAAQHMCQAAPHEFPRAALRAGRRDDVLVVQKTRRINAPPLAVVPGGETSADSPRAAHPKVAGALG